MKSSPMRLRLSHHLRGMLVSAVRRVFPGFFAAIDEVRVLRHRIEKLTEKHASLEALGWDHLATTRRLAALEDRIEELTRTLERGGIDWKVSVPYEKTKPEQAHAEVG